jgi:hypothetical protein
MIVTKLGFTIVTIFAVADQNTPKIEVEIS